MFGTPMLMLKMKFFWLILCGKIEQKTQKSICLQNQWKLKNINKAIVMKNMIFNQMLFAKSISDQIWRSYRKKTIFFIFHFLKFLPIIILLNSINDTLLLPSNALQWSDVFSNQAERQPKRCEQIRVFSFCFLFSWVFSSPCLMFLWNISKWDSLPQGAKSVKALICQIRNGEGNIVRLC